MSESQALSFKDRLAEYICDRGHVTFIEILEQFPEADGDTGIMHSENDTLVLWSRGSGELIDVINALQAERRIFMWQASSLTYLLDGGGLRLPIAKSNRRYKKPHWLPVTFHHRPPNAAELEQMKRAKYH